MRMTIDEAREAIEEVFWQMDQSNSVSASNYEYRAGVLSGMVRAFKAMGIIGHSQGLDMMEEFEKLV